MTDLEWLALIVFIMFTYGIIIGGSYICSKKELEMYKKLRAQMGWLPPRWVYWWIWMIVNGLTTAGIYLFWVRFDNPNVSDSDFNTTFILYVIAIILSKFWDATFFCMQRFGVSALLTAGICGTATGALALMGTTKSWLAFGLFFIFPFWAFVAFWYTGVVWMYYSGYINDDWIAYRGKNQRAAKRAPKQY